LHFSDFSIIFYEFSKFNSKRKYTFAERSLEGFESFQTGPWQSQRGTESQVRRRWSLAARAEGTKSKRRSRFTCWYAWGQRARGDQGAPTGMLGWVRDGRRWLVGIGAEHGGGGAPARERRQGVVD